MAGAGAAALAMPGPAWAGFFGTPPAGRLNWGRLTETHDLPSLPAWGPYSKKYFGISYIPELSRGLSFDCSFFPLLARGPNTLPSVMDPSGVHPWEASPELEFYSLRQELIWKDQCYCDLSYTRLTDDRRLVRMELVNQTAEPQEITLNGLAQMVFPPVRELTSEPIRLCRPALPPGGLWTHALDYEELEFATPRPTDNLVPDGKWRGEERRHDCVEGSVLAENFGKGAGDTVSYRLRTRDRFANAVLIWRFQADSGSAVVLEMTGTAGQPVPFAGSGRFDRATVPLGELPPGEHTFRFVSRGGSPVALNGFALVESELAPQVQFVDLPWHPVPEMEAAGNGVILKFEDAPDYFGLTLGLPLAGRRQLKWQDLDAAFRTEPGPNTRERILGNRRRGRPGDPDSLFLHVFSAPLTLAPDSRRVVYGLVCTGHREQVRGALAGFDPEASGNEMIHAAAREKAFRPAASPGGERFRFSQQLMAAVTLTNLVYPVYTQRKYIRHYSPGRSWDCLYTWDAGFIGLGLAEIDLRHATEILNTYLTAPGSQSAFIHHGSPVPVQIYLFQELWNRTQSRELLAHLYPRVRQYHRFLAGRLGSSTTRKHRDHLICTWDYFYNSGGWDDYAPQKFVHQEKLEAAVTPASNSCHAIRCAKILRQAALALGHGEDLPEYDADISTLATSLQRFAWDAGSGYFGYVVHDAGGEPTGILRHESGVNFNMGLDGIYPLAAGICTSEQEDLLLDRIFSPKHLWMDIGITTVDQSAPYFIPNGYWNGSVWLAHQWFFWKTMLDLGRADLALRIARTGLALWKEVTDDTYDCMEHFVPTTPHGAGWHQFSSLSSPALSWFASLYTPGRLTAGFDVWLERCEFSHGNRQLRAKLKADGPAGRPFSVLACLLPGDDYEARWNGHPAACQSVHDGLVQVQLPRQPGGGELVIRARGSQPAP